MLGSNWHGGRQIIVGHCIGMHATDQGRVLCSIFMPGRLLTGFQTAFLGMHTVEDPARQVLDSSIHIVGVTADNVIVKSHTWLDAE